MNSFFPRKLVQRALLLSCSMLVVAQAGPVAAKVSGQAAEPLFAAPLSKVYNVAEFTQPWHVVNYWSLWCPPCRREIPEFNQLALQWQGSDVVMLGVNFDDDDQSTTLSIAKEMGIAFPTIWQAGLTANPPPVLPSTYFFYRGKLMLSLHGEQKASRILDVLKHLKENTKED